MKKRWVMGLLVGLVFLFSLTACGELSSLSDTGDAFMSALNTGDHATSYQMLHPDIQAEVGGEAGWAEWASIRNFESWKFDSSSFENNTGELLGSAELDGVTYEVALYFEKINDAWIINGISFE